MQKNKKIRLVIDVNVWISALFSSDFRHRIDAVFDPEKYHLLVSKELFDELDDAARKPYPAKRIVRSEYEQLVLLLKTEAELVKVHSIVDICRDPKDNYLLALTKDGNADYLLTGDSDLRVLKKFEKTKIVDMNEFESL